MNLQNFLMMVTALCLAGCSNEEKKNAEVELAKAAQLKAEAELAKTKAELELEKVKNAKEPEEPEKPKVDPELQEFRDKVDEYLEEARIGTKLFSLAPSLAEINEKARHITNLFTRLPDIPPGVDPTGKVAEKLKNINGAFAVAETHIKIANDFKRLNAIEEFKKIHEVDLPKLAEDVKKFSEEIKTAIHQ